MKKFVKQLRQGQITIPKEMREALGLRQEDLLSITLTEGKLEIEPVRVTPKARGSPWAQELYSLFAPVRQSLETHTEQEIEQAIKEAIGETRAEAL